MNRMNRSDNLADGVSDTMLDRLLEAIERTELTSLRWGYVDGALSRDALNALAQTQLNMSLVDMDDTIEGLINRRLLREFEVNGVYHYRSRFAESVRLLRDLKLLTAKRPWSAASNLVSDFRVDARPRRVPRRDVSTADAINALALSSVPAENAGIVGILGKAGTLRHDLAFALLNSTRSGPEGLHLAPFQVRAAQAILKQQSGNHGVVISAGTGSGKTFAFYLPALIEIGSWVEKDEHWTKALALYPRVELLKDQFNEAYHQARLLDATLLRHGRRPVTIGALFSPVPYAATAEALKQRGWREARNAGFICPFLACPKCGGELLWPQIDLAKKVERLVCRRPSCGGVVTGDQVALTRERIVARPPDILFTTAEMLNQRLSDTKLRVIFGVHQQKSHRVRMALLDEIHTYTGTAGAQTALVLRRWRHAVGRSLRLVGLSATLREAPNFFAQLTGLFPSQITEIAPFEQELDRVSTEYQLILRGDPVSQTSLLSTSIQASYLLARLLDTPSSSGPNRGAISDGRFGSRMFVFTDDLDVVNRFFDDLRNAEGYDLFGNPQPDRPPLAALRSSSQPDLSPSERSRRDAAGQIWQLCEEIKRSPTDRLRITRTTSQDSGVSASSDIVVATSSLEVGFDDETVGAVLQHKSPYTMASFMQRKGRAGRKIQMRPWMVTILSDYGRDRLAYQSYEQLFDPTLPPQQLPIHNDYVLRMQAVFSFIDWLANNLATTNVQTWWWRPLNAPKENDKTSKEQRAALTLIQALLDGEEQPLKRLTDHLAQALQITADDVHRLLWEPPRSLLLEALPTLYRRLRDNWRIPATLGRAAATDLTVPLPNVQPLPDFIPASLFSDLNLPEVGVILPPATRGADARDERLPIVKTLGLLAPGRVTRRFAVERGGLSHWVPVPFNSGDYLLRISDFIEQSEFVATVTAEVDGELRQMPCFRPWVARMQVVPGNVDNMSNAYLTWSSQIVPASESLPLSMHGSHGWEGVIVQLELYLHRFRMPVTIRRFTIGATATLRLKNTPEDQIVSTRFTTDEGELATVGFEQEVDGICMRVRLPSAEKLVEQAASSAEVPGWRAAYFRDLVLYDEQLAALTNKFQRDWLYQIYLSALVSQASRNGTTLEQAHTVLRDELSQQALLNVMDGIFQMISEAETEPENDAPAETAETSTGRLQQRLTDLLGMAVVRQRLAALAPALWSPAQMDWGIWLRSRLHETIGEALLLACTYIAPQHLGAGSLLLDLKRGASLADDPERTEAVDTVEVWITESTLGGGGIIEAIAEIVAEDPIKLTRALAAALAPGGLEMTSNNLDRFIRLALGDETVANAVAMVRRSNDHALRDQARAVLYTLLASRGIGVDHSLSSALNHRLLRAGSDPASDQLIADLLEAWQRAEEQLGIAIDLRVFCYLAASDPSFGPRLSAFLYATTGASATIADIVGVVSSVLWPRAIEVRSHVLAGYSPFRERGFTDPALVRELALTEHIAEVSMSLPNWLAHVQEQLASRGAVRLVALREDQTERALREALERLLATPINVDYLQFYPSVEDVRRDEKRTTVTLIIREFS